jgi:Septum formation
MGGHSREAAPPQPVTFGPVAAMYHRPPWTHTMESLDRVKSVLIGVVIGIAMSACSNDGGSSSATTTYPTSAVTSTAADVAPPPHAGQCRNTSPDRLESFPGRPVAHGVRARDWVDETPVVDCSKPHTLETVEVVTLAEKPTLALVKQLAGSCPSAAALGYLGITFPAFRTLEFVVYWPSPTQRSAGQSWVRCDVGVRAETGCCRLAPQTGSLRHAVGRDPVRFDTCIGAVPDPSRLQPLSSCKKPHAGEVLPTLLGADVTRYPSPASLDHRGRVGCAKLTADRPDHADLVIASIWRPLEVEWSGEPLEGFCFIHRKSGLLPPLH